ncbi:cation:proton antiporter [Millionella massiliensis]|uniref:cation:proton antiporter n=1 Tax=Millionella massiliensis TaxID=1871023 RepID=UPI0023A88B3B|nr:cation:proton antiporter [Millionella massiliensis]
MLVSFAYIFLLGLSMGYIFNRLRLPALLGMLISGIILGPYALNALSPSLLSVSVELRQIALVIILMRAGLALDINDLKRVGRPALLMCFVPACFEIAGMMLVAPALLDISLLDAAVMGTVVAAVSPAIIVPKMLYLMDNQIGTRKSIPQMIMAGGSVDDVFVIVLFTAFTTLSLGGEVSAASFVQIPVSIVTGLALGIGVGWLLSRYFRRFHMRDSIKVLIMMSLAFLFLGLEGWLKGIVPISGLLAVMAMGATLLKTYPLLAKRISPKYSKLWVAAEILLFVLVGATADIKFALAAGLAAVGVIFIVLLFRMVGVFVCMIHTDLTLHERLFCMIAYLPKATVQAAIGSLPLAMGLPCGKIVLTVAVLAILITAPLGAFGIDMTYKRLLMPSGRDQADPGNIPADSLGEFGGQNRNE